LQYDYYWRVDSDVEFHCPFDYDPFEWMRDNKIEYGFTIIHPEYRATIPTLWQTAQDFLKKNSNLPVANNSMQLITNSDGTYNTCHFWTNFEIANLNFYRSQNYLDYFQFLDESGGFFYERWGDAPVHSIAAAMMLDKKQIHWFEDIGYYHAPTWNCPEKKGCTCDSKLSWQRYKKNLIPCYNAWKNLHANPATTPSFS